MKELVIGRKAISKPSGTNKRFNRQKYEGSKVAVPGDYRGALALGHTVVPIIMEVFGGWGPDACKLFRQVARCHRDLHPRPCTHIVGRTLLLSLPLSAHLHCHPLLSCR